jgi:hypothetical protein
MRDTDEIRRELKRVETLRVDGRKHRTRENYERLVGAEWALRWVLNLTDADAAPSRAVKAIIAKIVGRH